jgi:hypothetical protein
MEGIVFNEVSPVSEQLPLLPISRGGSGNNSYQLTAAVLTGLRVVTNAPAKARILSPYKVPNWNRPIYQPSRKVRGVWTSSEAALRPSASFAFFRVC